MYPTLLIILVQKQKSLWDTPEMSDSTFGSHIPRGHSAPVRSHLQFAVAGDSGAGTSTLGSSRSTREQSMIAMKDLHSKTKDDHEPKDDIERAI